MTWLLVIHVITAMVYVGGHILENLLLYRHRDMDGRSRVFNAIRVGEPAINVAAPIMILTGVAMVVLDDAWKFSDPFVMIGLGAIVVSVVLGLPLLKEMKSLDLLIREQGETGEVNRRYKRLANGWSALAGVYLVAVWAMVVKP